MAIDYDGLSIEWLGHATTRIGFEETVVYLDPGRYGVLDDCRPEDADLVLVTSADHYDSDGIERVAGPETVIVACTSISADSIDRSVAPLHRLGHDLHTVAAGDTLTVAGVGVEATPAYNTPEGHTDETGAPYYEPGDGVGYLLSIDGVRVFYPGDSDPIEEHTGLEVEVFLAPIGGTFAMDAEGAAECAQALGAELVIPVHYGTYPAIEADPERFRADLESRGIEVAVLEPGE